MKSWSENYATSIKILDEQHKELFNILDNCYDLLLNNKEEDKYDKIINILEKLRDYTIYHFNTEEEFLKKNNYSKFLSHKFAHDAFIEQINGYDIYSIDKDQKGSVNEILDIVSSWIKNHILDIDKNIPNLLQK